MVPLLAAASASWRWYCHQSRPAPARRAIAGYCARTALPDALAAAAALATSELVTNALMHARAPILMLAEYPMAPSRWLSRTANPYCRLTLSGKGTGGGGC
jgi:hypothetical protein